jgi:predicted nucleic acid-binding protein
MILVDTSILIDYLKGIENKQTILFDKFLEQNTPYGISDYTYQELLQGSKTNEEFARLKEYLGTLTFYHLHFGKESFEKAAFIYFQCRKSGITIRSSTDLLIAEIAIENNLLLLHNDKDFENMSTVIPELKIYK